MRSSSEARAALPKPQRSNNQTRRQSFSTSCCRASDFASPTETFANCAAVGARSALAFAFGAMAASSRRSLGGRRRAKLNQTINNEHIKRQMLLHNTPTNLNNICPPLISMPWPRIVLSMRSTLQHTSQISLVKRQRSGDTCGTVQIDSSSTW